MHSILSSVRLRMEQFEREVFAYQFSFLFRLELHILAINRLIESFVLVVFHFLLRSFLHELKKLVLTYYSLTVVTIRTYLH